jgi:hypothetical protein
MEETRYSDKKKPPVMYCKKSGWIESTNLKLHKFRISSIYKQKGNIEYVIKPFTLCSIGRDGQIKSFLFTLYTYHTYTYKSNTDSLRKIIMIKA